MFMNTNDQWFQPGDKVMRVAFAAWDFGLPTEGVDYPPETEKGKVLCVAACTTHGKYNFVRFVGVVGFYYACCFRKIEEIKLCVRAAEKFHQPATTEPETAEA
jgi:hypothetical protein